VSLLSVSWSLQAVFWEHLPVLTPALAGVSGG
jgi:hypothetical protein